MRYFISRHDAYQAEHTQAIWMQMQFFQILILNIGYQMKNRNAEVVYLYGDFTLQQRCGERHFHAGIDIDLLEIQLF